MATRGGDDGEETGDEDGGGWKPQWREKAEKRSVAGKMGREGWFSANFEFDLLLPHNVKFAPIYRGGRG